MKTFTALVFHDDDDDDTMTHGGARTTLSFSGQHSIYYL